MADETDDDDDDEYEFTWCWFRLITFDAESGGDSVVLVRQNDRDFNSTFATLELPMLICRNIFFPSEKIYNKILHCSSYIITTWMKNNNKNACSVWCFEVVLGGASARSSSTLAHKCDVMVNDDGKQ